VESPEGAQAVVDADVFDYLPRLFNSWYGEIRKGAAELLGRLAAHDFVLKVILNSNLCTQFACLLRRVRFLILDLDTDKSDSDGWDSVVLSAQRALSRIAGSPEGAQAVVDANVLDVLLDLIQSPPYGLDRYHPMEILETLTTHEFGLKLVLNSNFCTQLVNLLRRVRLPNLGLDADE
jgi:hypothetical protein